MKNIYELAKDCYPMLLVHSSTNWEQESHNYRALIMIEISKFYPNILDDCNDCVQVIHKKGFDVLEYKFSDEFIKRILEKYPEALI